MHTYIILTIFRLKVEDQEAKLKAKLERKEEKMKQAKFIKEWTRKREDLECEDLRVILLAYCYCKCI